MTFALIANTGIGSVAGNDITSSNIDTTGANLIVVLTTYFGTSAGTFTDSKSNTWTQIGSEVASGSNKSRLWYCYAPTVGSGHTFTTTCGAGTFPTVTVSAWSGSASSPLDQTTGNAASQPGSITPTLANELLVTGSTGSGAALSVNGGFTITDNIAFSGGAHVAGAQAYLIQTTATAANPTWTNGVSTIIASFKVSTGGASVTYPQLERGIRGLNRGLAIIKGDGPRKPFVAQLREAA